MKTDQDNFIVDAPFPTLLLARDIQSSPSPSSPSDGKANADDKGKDGKWEVETLAREIKLLEGVLSVGLFVGFNGEQAAERGMKTGGQKPVAAYFGMEDGGVVIRSQEGEREKMNAHEARESAEEKAGFK